MDPRPPHVLGQIKKEITASTEWERVIQDLCILLEQSFGRHQLRNFEGLSGQEQHELMRHAAGKLQRINTFKDLQSKVSSTLAQADVIPSLHIDKESQSAGTRNRSLLTSTPPSCRLGSENAAKACAYLLQEHHHLKHYIKKCFNHPLPVELRLVAWKVLLQFDSSAVRRGHLPKPRSFSVISFKEESKEDQKISRKCESTLRSSPFFSELARSPVIMEAMKSIMVSWRRYKDDQQPDGQPSDTEFLLCLPFLYTWLSKLEKEDRASGISSRYVEQMQPSLTDAAEVYVSFMEDAYIKVAKCMQNQEACERSIILYHTCIRNPLTCAQVPL